MEYKYLPEPKPSYEEHHMKLHAWYTKDKTGATQAELVEIFAGL
jgi:hypothetical protein